jgi:hypothetical protein
MDKKDGRKTPVQYEIAPKDDPELPERLTTEQTGPAHLDEAWSLPLADFGASQKQKRSAGWFLRYGEWA